MPSEYDALLDAQPAQQKSEYDALLEQPKQEGGVLSGIAAGIGRALNPINLIKGALDIGGESDISKISRYSHSLADIVSGKPVQESLQANIPEVAQQRAALTGQLGGREQAAEITGLGLQAGLLALPFAHGKLATLRETAFGKTEAPLASETAAAKEVINNATQEGVVKEDNIVQHPGDGEGGAPSETSGSGGTQPSTQAPQEKVATAAEAFPSLLQSAEEARRSELRQEPAPVSEPTETTAAQPLTQEKGGEVGEKVQVKGEDEGKGKEGVLTPEAQKLVESGGVPSFVSKNLERIATENGVDVGNKTPNQIIDELKSRAATVQPPAAGGPSIAQVAKRPITPPESGEAVGWEQTTDQGHDWLDKGGDPSKLIDDFRRTGKVSVPIMGRMNAALDRIQATTNATGDALDKAPNDPALQAAYETAKQNEQTFTEAYKPMHTVASNTLRSLQGERPLTEEMAQSYTGLNRRFIERMGRDFTPEESTKARKLTEKTKTVNKEYVDKTQELYKRMETEYGRIKGPRGTSIEDLSKMFRENLNEVCDV